MPSELDHCAYPKSSILMQYRRFRVGTVVQLRGQSSKKRYDLPPAQWRKGVANATEDEAGEYKNCQKIEIIYVYLKQGFQHLRAFVNSSEAHKQHIDPNIGNHRFVICWLLSLSGGSRCAARREHSRKILQRPTALVSSYPGVSDTKTTRSPRLRSEIRS